MELCSMLCARLDGRGFVGRVDPCICTAEFLRCSPETATALLISYNAIQNKKFKVWGEKKLAKFILCHALTNSKPYQ